MNVVFRCDGNSEIGAGHLVRCSALAREITRRGGRAVLACRAIPECLRWAASGAAAIPLPADVLDGETDVERGLGRADWASLLEVAGQWRADWVFVDHYGAGGEYLRAVWDAGYRLVVMDDTGGRDLRAAGLVVNPNLGADSIHYDLRQGAALCRGPAFAALRPEFIDARARINPKTLESRLRSAVTEVFVGFGGSRLGGIAGEVAGAIGSWASAPRVSVAQGLNAAATAAAMSESGMAVSAAGSTVWELCCLGVPAVIWPIAENQRGIAEALGRTGAAVVARGLDEALAAARELQHSPGRRAALGLAAWELVDGLGAARVVNELGRLMGE